MEPWRETGSEIVLTADVSASEDKKDGNETKPGGRDVRIGVYGDGDLVGGVAESPSAVYLRKLQLRLPSILFCEEPTLGN